MDDAAQRESESQRSERRIDRMLSDYAVTHSGVANRALQAIALPLIVWSLIALLTGIPFPAAWRIVPGLDWAALATLAVVLGFVGLSWPIAAGLGALSIVSIVTARAYSRWGELPIWQLAITLLVAGYLLHLLGRRLDGLRLGPREEIRSLIVGPAWLLSLVYRLLGVRY